MYNKLCFEKCFSHFYQRSKLTQCERDREMDALEISQLLTTTIVTILSCFGNSLVVISLVKFHWLRVTTNYFVAVLAFYDFCNGLPTSTFGLLTSYVGGGNVTSLNAALCRVTVGLAAFSGYGNVLCVIIVTVDRYIFINRPLGYHAIVTNKKAILVSALCFTVAVVVAFLAVHGQPVSIPCTTIRVLSPSVALYLVLPTLIIAVILVVLLYGENRMAGSQG